MIPIVLDPEPNLSIALAEHCCICDRPTHYWTSLPNRTEGQQVACCKACARKSSPTCVTTKDQWFEAEEKRHPRMFT